MIQPEISLYLLAKQAKADGQINLFWKYVQNHAYVMRKYFEQQKKSHG